MVCLNSDNGHFLTAFPISASKDLLFWTSEISQELPEALEIPNYQKIFLDSLSWKCPSAFLHDGINRREVMGTAGSSQSQRMQPFSALLRPWGLAIRPPACPATGTLHTRRDGPLVIRKTQGNFKVPRRHFFSFCFCYAIFQIDTAIVLRIIL